MNKKIDNFISKYNHLLPIEAQLELQEIRQDQCYLKKIFERNPCTIAILDEKDVYVNANPQLLEVIPHLIGTKLGEISGETAVIKLVQNLRAGKEECLHDVITTKFNGETKVIWLSVTKVGDKVLTTGMDITHIKQLEQEKSFNAQLALLGEMSSFIVHEINNPLSSMMMATEIIKFTNEDGAQNNDIDENVEQIFNMIEVIKKIISSLKTLSRRNSGEKQELNLESLVEKSQVILSGKIKRGFATISTEGLKGIIVEGNETEFLQVLVNLISNSIDAIQTLEEKWIKIKWASGCLKIIDSGKGIPQEIERKLFNKFYSSKGEKGNGVGLYLSKNLLQKNGFSLEYKLEQEHTSFQWIPLTQEKVA